MRATSSWSRVNKDPMSCVKKEFKIDEEFDVDEEFEVDEEIKVDEEFDVDEEFPVDEEYQVEDLSKTEKKLKIEDEFLDQIRTKIPLYQIKFEDIELVEEPLELVTEECYSASREPTAGKLKLKDEVMPPYSSEICEDQMPQIKKDIKIEEEFFEDYEDTVIQASCSQVKFEDIELVEEPLELVTEECYSVIGEPTADRARVSTGEVNYKSEEPSDSCGSKLGSEGGHAYRAHDGLNTVQKSKCFKCSSPNCDFAFSLKRNLTMHIKAVHEKLKDFKCPKCDYACSRKGSLVSHIKSVHENLKPCYKCPNCDHTCRQEIDLFKHIKIVHEKFKPFNCPSPNCDYACTRKEFLSFHIRSVHKMKKSTEFRSACPYCNYTCSNVNILYQHMKSAHENRKQFKYPNLNGHFAATNNEHLFHDIDLFHEKWKSFKCAMCEYTCDQNEHLSFHLKTVHGKLKEFKCPNSNYRPILPRPAMHVYPDT